MSTNQNYPVEFYQTLRDVYRTGAAEHGESIAFMQKENGSYQGYSYARFAKDVDRLGTALCAKGLKGKHILLMGESCYRWILSYMAVICGVGVIVPVDYALTTEALADLAQKADASAIIYSDKQEATVSALDPAIEKIPFSSLDAHLAEGKRLVKRGCTDYTNAPLDPNAMSAILFTSGTAGSIKGVMLSHANICFNLSEMCSMVRIQSDDVFLSILPLHHTFECTCGVLVPLSKGATVAFAESLRRMMQNMQEVHPTVINCVPMFMETIYRKLWANIRKQELEKRVRSLIKMTNALRPERVRLLAKRKAFAAVHKSFGGKLRAMISCGAAVNPEVVGGLRDFGIKAIQSYGLTECAPLAAINRDTSRNDKSAGTSTPNGLLDIYDLQNDGTGEIRYKGKNVMLGYYNKPELTQKVLRDGWLYTGDLGYLDENGYLYVTGRKRNIINKASGKQVYPEELELLLHASPYVKDSVVIGRYNEQKKDNDVVAIILPDIPAIIEKYGRNYTAAQLDSELKKAISDVNVAVPAHKRIQSHVLRREEFAKNTSGKVYRAPIIAEYTNQSK